MVNILKADGTTEYKWLASLSNRAGAPDPAVLQTVNEIIEDVRENGDEALLRYASKFGGGTGVGEPIGRDVLKQSFLAIDDGLRQALLNASDNIKQYHKNQLPHGYEVKKDDDSLLGQLTRPLLKVGIYVPGGTASYPSTVLMNAILAKIAGVEEIIMVTPKRDNMDVVLAAGFIAGVDKVVLAGGAQVIAALAYGTESIPKVDKIVGPGNIYVATAKRQVYGAVDIDMIAGPSEILIIADKDARADFIAADMLSQAEHDEQSAAILLTTSERLAETVRLELVEQVGRLGRADITRKSLVNNGKIIQCRSEDEMVKLANYIAPEHLEIMVDDPLRLLSEIKNAGSIFLGDYSPEPLGDYYSGTNHVLPTSGTARFASPLGVYDFIKRTSYTYYTKEALQKASDDIVQIARSEGLDAHLRAVEIRRD